MYPPLTDEQRQLRTQVRQFVCEHVAPVSGHYDRRERPEDCWPSAIIEELSKSGIRTVTLCRDLGGGGIDYPTTAMLVEELAVGDMGVSVIMAQNWKIQQLIEVLGTEEQRKRFLIPYRDDPQGVLSICSTELHAGSDNILPYNAPGAGSTMSVADDGDGFVLDGTKRFISNGNRAMLYVVAARTDQRRGVGDGTTYFLVPREASGVQIEHVHDKSGERLVNNAIIRFDRVRIPRSNLLGSINDARNDRNYFRRITNVYAAASVLGVAVAALQQASAFARERVQGGKPIIEHQAVQLLLADMAIGIESARALIRQTAYLAQHDESFDFALPSICKVHATNVAMKAALDNAEVHGGLGLMRDYLDGAGPEKLVRDASVFLHSDGTQTIHRLRVAEKIREGRSPLAAG